jgi:hypothetical protein
VSPAGATGQWCASSAAISRAAWVIASGTGTVCWAWARPVQASSAAAAVLIIRSIHHSLV